MLLAAFVVLLVVDVLTTGAKAVNEREDDVYRKLAELGLGKRAAYSYVSEYKRLPVYNFGLGKRAQNNEGRLYSFGIGKRDYDSSEDIEYVDDELALKDEQMKRAKLYSFGLGKRLPIKMPEGKMYSFGLGKRTASLAEQLPYFIDDQTDSSEESKRSTTNNNGHRFSFGLGKRHDEEYQEKRKGEKNMHYSFGLGKRTQADAVSSSNLHN